MRVDLWKSPFSPLFLLFAAWLGAFAAWSGASLKRTGLLFSSSLFLNLAELSSASLKQNALLFFLSPFLFWSSVRVDPSAHGALFFSPLFIYFEAACELISRHAALFFSLPFLFILKWRASWSPEIHFLYPLLLLT